MINTNPPSYLSADGGEAVLLATLDGCEVWAVKRLTRPLGGTPQRAYWTAVTQTGPGKEQSKAYNPRRSATLAFTSNSVGVELAYGVMLVQGGCGTFGVDSPACIQWHDAPTRAMYEATLARAGAPPGGTR